MKKQFQQFISAAMIVAFGVVGLTSLVPQTAAAAVDPGQSVQNGINAAGGNPKDKGQKNLGEVIKLVINILLFIIGVVSVIMIILGGLKYVLSNGDSSAVTSAKNTILYAVIGLIVALLAYAIVNFVVAQFTK